MKIKNFFTASLLFSLASLCHAERRGIVIGNRDYSDAGRFPDLATTLNDAELMQRLMVQAGFKMAPMVKDATRLGMEEALIKFCEGLKQDDEVVVYYAGHGVQYENKVYLMGTNAEFRIKAKLSEEGVSQETLASMLGERGIKLAVLILDCCREVPDQSWLASDHRSRGLRGDEAPALTPPPNILVGYATSSGRLTNDSLRETDANGPLVLALQKHWNEGLEFDPLWKAVARDVFTASRSAEQGGAELQMPSKYGQTIHDFYFVTARANAASTSPAEGMAGMSAKTEATPAIASDDGKPVNEVLPAKGGWEIVKIGGRDYVTAESIRNYYGPVYDFTTFHTQGTHFSLGSSKLILKAQISSQEMLINNIKSYLSFPVLEHNGKVFFSRLDLVKLIDPVLYPSHIQNAEYFDTVVIDPGHGGKDFGVQGVYANGLHGTEKDFTLKMAMSVRTALMQRGLKVLMTRTTDTFVSEEQRVKMANVTPKSIFISLQFNAGTSDKTGIETLALTPQRASATLSRDGGYNTDGVKGNQQDSANISLATAIHASVISRFKFVDLGIKRGQMTVLSDCTRPGVLFRGGFITNEQECELIASETYRQHVSAAIGDAVLNYRKALESAMTADGRAAGKTAAYTGVTDASATAADKKANTTTNSLGMEFALVPIGAGTSKGKKVLFSIWETRSKDYAVFMQSGAYTMTGSGVEDWKNYQYGGVPVGRGAGEMVAMSNHPISNVSHEDAKAFCEWLTKKERTAGRIRPKDEYRLPTDAEWSYAVGVGGTEDASTQPIYKNKKGTEDYPWGRGFPPPPWHGNYADEDAKAQGMVMPGVIANYRDGYATTAPAGSYKPNELGLYDLGGNLSEWCADWLDAMQKERVLRGAAWNHYDAAKLLSSFRYQSTPEKRDYNVGFRCVLELSDD